MRDRLIELVDRAFLKSDDNYGIPNTEQVVDYLIANAVSVQPCKVGDTVYFHHIVGTNEDTSPIVEVRAGTVYKTQIERDNQIWLGVSFGIWYCCRLYTDFYFTKEEAEKALKERERK